MNRKFRFLTVTICLVISAYSNSWSQSTGGVGFFTPGVHSIRFSDLNSSLPAGFPMIKNKPFYTGGAGYGIFSNFVLGGEGGTMYPGSYTEGDQVVDLSGKFGFFSLGYVVFNKKGLLVYPMASIGDHDLTMYLHQKNLPGNYEGITGEPFQATTLHFKTRMLKFSVAGLYVLQGAKSDSGSAGLMIGLEAGYQMGYKPGVWSYDNGEVDGGPDFSNNCFFIQLMIGGGGVMRKN